MSSPISGPSDQPPYTAAKSALHGEGKRPNIATAFSALFPEKEFLKGFSIGTYGELVLTYDAPHEVKGSGVKYAFSERVVVWVREGGVQIKEGVRGVIKKVDWQKEIVDKIGSFAASWLPAEISVPIEKVREVKEKGIEVIAKVALCEIPILIESETLLDIQMARMMERQRALAQAPPEDPVDD